MSTLLLSRSDVASVLTPRELLPQLRDAFQAYSLERTIAAQRARSDLPGVQMSSAVLLFPGLIPGIPAYTVKDHAKFPGCTPAIQGVINLHDLTTGKLLAMMDSSYITGLRTSLAGALAADVLARPDAQRVAIIGAGVQGESQLRSLLLVRHIEHVKVFDTAKNKAATYANKMGEELDIFVQPCTSVADAVRDADIIITATWSRTPFLHSEMIEPGTHITTLGPDEPGKCEVSAELIQKSLFICDDRNLAVTMGAIAGAGLEATAIQAELGEIIGGTKPGRANNEQITIFGGVGLAFQDLAAAWYVYEKVSRETQYQHFDFLR